MQRLILPLLFLVTLGTTVAQTSAIEVPRTQRSIITKLSATWCSICGGVAWDNYSSLVSSYEKDALVLNAHVSTSSELYSKTSKDLLANFESASSQPVFFFNAQRVGSGGSSMMTSYQSLVNDAKLKSPTAQSGLNVYYNETTQKLTIQTKTRFFEAASGEYTLSLLLLEKEAIADQTNRGSGVVHKRVLRQSITPTVTGQAVASGTIAKDAEYTNTFEYTLSDGSPTKYQYALILWKKNGTAFTFVNTNHTNTVSDAAILTATRQADAGLSGLQVINQPGGEILVQAQVNEGSRKAVLHVSDMQGRVLFYKALGALTTQSSYQWRLPETALLPNGTYIVSIQTERGVSGEKWTPLR